MPPPRSHGDRDAPEPAPGRPPLPQETQGLALTSQDSRTKGPARAASTLVLPLGQDAEDIGGRHSPLGPQTGPERELGCTVSGAPLP